MTAALAADMKTPSQFRLCDSFTQSKTSRKRVMAFEASIIPARGSALFAARGAHQKCEDFPLSSTLQSAGCGLLVDRGALVACDTLYGNACAPLPANRYARSKPCRSSRHGLTAVKEAMASSAAGCVCISRGCCCLAARRGGLRAANPLGHRGRPNGRRCRRPRAALLDKRGKLLAPGDINCEADRLAWLNGRFPAGSTTWATVRSDREPLHGARLIHVDCDGRRQHAGIEQSDIRRGRALLRPPTDAARRRTRCAFINGAKICCCSFRSFLAEASPPTRQQS